VGVAVERTDEAAGGDLPQADPSVLACGGEDTAVGAEGQVEDEPLVGEEGQPLRAGGRLPELDGPVPAAGGQPSAVGAEGDAIDPVDMPVQLADFDGAHDVPDLDDLRAGDRQVPTVRVEGQVVDPSLRPGEGDPFVAGRNVVDLDGMGTEAAVFAESDG